MAFTYPKSEKLKSRKTIEKLFSEGKSVSKFPLRLVFVPSDEFDGKIQMGVSVSKRNFKKAVDRNYFKRCLREGYRMNKHILADAITKTHAFMLLYQTSDRLTSREIQQKTKLLFEKFASQINGTPE